MYFWSVGRSFASFLPFRLFVHVGKKTRADSDWPVIRLCKDKNSTHAWKFVENLAPGDKPDKHNLTRKSKWEIRRRRRCRLRRRHRVLASQEKKVLHDYLHSYLQKIQFKKNGNVMRRGELNKYHISFFFFIWCLIRPYKPSKMFPTDNKHYAGERKKRKLVKSRPHYIFKMWQIFFFFNTHGILTFSSF